MGKNCGLFVLLFLASFWLARTPTHFGRSYCSGDFHNSWHELCPVVCLHLRMHTVSKTSSAVSGKKNWYAVLTPSTRTECFKIECGSSFREVSEDSESRLNFFFVILWMAAARKVIDLSVILCFVAILPRFKRTQHLIISGCIVFFPSTAIVGPLCISSGQFWRHGSPGERYACSFFMLSTCQPIVLYQELIVNSTWVLIRISQFSDKLMYQISWSRFSGQCPATEFHVGGLWIWKCTWPATS